MSAHPEVCVCVRKKVREMDLWCEIVWPQQREIIWLAKIMNEALCKKPSAAVCVCVYASVCCLMNIWSVSV